MADTKYYAVVTDLGTREMLRAVNEKRKVNITQFAAGDGGGQYYVPDTAMTELKNEVWRGGINTCRISEESENVMIVETVIPSDEGGFTIREMAVFDENGIMIAVCNTPDTAKVRVTDGVVHELLLKMEILLNNKDSVQLVTDPNIVTATKQDLKDLKKELLAQIFQISYDPDEEMLVIGAVDENTGPGSGNNNSSGDSGSSGDNTGTGDSGSAAQAVPPATADTLGPVKVGDGLNVAEDGTISVDTDKTAEKAAGIITDSMKSITDDNMKQLFGGQETQAE